MISTLLIIDAMNLIRRIYAIQEKQHGETDKAVKETCATASNAVQKLIKIHAPTHVIAVFDSHAKNWRHDLFPDYKKGRKPIPTLLKNGLTEIQDQFFELGVDSLVSEEDEADDLIATLVHKVNKHQQRAIIVSTDKGFYQLLNKQTVIYDHFQNKYTDNIKVSKEMQLSINQLCDYWAIVGSSSCAIKGVEGVGQKGALTLIQNYLTLDNIFSAEASSDKRILKVQAQQQSALLAKQLFTLKIDLTLGFNLQDLRLNK